MIFNSFQFLWLFPLIFIIYWGTHFIMRQRGNAVVAKYLLLLISLGVYLQWSVTFFIVLIGVGIFSYTIARLIDRSKSKSKAILAIGVAVTLSPLFVFKYYNFINETGASALQWIGIDVAKPTTLFWVVPLGLSFYSFQAIGYLVDVYRKTIKPEKNFFTYLLFVSFFPQIICGPISRGSDLLPQLRNLPGFDYDKAVSGMRMILWGMFLKLVVADRLGLYVDTVYGHYDNYSSLTLFLASVFYSLQIYGDFAGYSYMAVGSARLLGISLITNFRRPYFAENISDFWKRWNISLTKWLTSNIYISLGGNRRGRLRTYLNIFLTFIVSGIWHGANLTFILWGAIHGVAQIINRLFSLKALKASNAFAYAIRVCLVFTVVNFAWIFFRAPSIACAFDYISRIFLMTTYLYVDSNTFAHAFIGIAVMFFIEYLMERRPGLFGTVFSNRLVRWSGYIALSLLILTMGVLDSSQFIYVRF